MPEIKMYYKKNQNYQVFPVGGVWGGLSPNGMVNCDFFIEKAENPESIIIDIDEKSGVIKEKDGNPKEQKLIRDLLFGAVMHPNTARSIGEWLISKANEYENLKIKGKEK